MITNLINHNTAAKKTFESLVTLGINLGALSNKFNSMEQSKDNRIIPMTSVDSGKLREAAPDVAYYTNQIVNLIMIGKPGEKWVLVDAGMPKSSKEILKVTAERFGAANPPQAIILTHGHFDHVGSIVDLVTEWNTPGIRPPARKTFPPRKAGLSRIRRNRRRWNPC